MKFQKRTLALAVFAICFLAYSCKEDESCFDGELNQNETGIDCGGVCTACISCFDGVQNGAETGVDCGGLCAACSVESQLTGKWEVYEYDFEDSSGGSISVLDNSSFKAVIEIEFMSNGTFQTEAVVYFEDEDYVYNYSGDWNLQANETILRLTYDGDWGMFDDFLYALTNYDGEDYIILENYDVASISGGVMQLEMEDHGISVVLRAEKN